MELLALSRIFKILTHSGFHNFAQIQN